MELKRDMLPNGRISVNELNVEVSPTFPGRVSLTLTSRTSKEVALNEREVDDLIVMLEYYKRVAKGEINE